MRTRSLGYRTDLAIRALEGSVIEDRGTYLVIRSPRNPGFWWGNFLLLPSLAPGSLDDWLARFAAEFPGARHATFGVDEAADGSSAASDLGEWTAAGFTVDRSAVLTASALRPPPQPNAEATYRPLAGDADWEQALRLRLAVDAGRPAGDPEFARARLAATRAMTEAGHATWHGAFLGDDLVAQMGIVCDASSGLARYQHVETHPDARRRGLAGTLTWKVGKSVLAAAQARTLVIVADPDGPAIAIYRSVGFTPAETQLALQRRPPE